jgi:predicted ATPase/class 3 adenylate cyclase
MGELPTGIVTLVFTDIEGSTRLLEHLGDDAYDAVLGEHHRILREAIAAHHGVEVSSDGDAFFLVFVGAGDALAAVLGAQVALARHRWPRAAAVRVRMGLNTGPVRLGGDDYVGLAVHQAARVCAAAHGGQVVVAEATRDAARAIPDGVSWRSLGRHRLKDLGAAVELFQLCHQDLVAEFPPLNTLEIVAHNLPMQASSFLGRDEELIAGAELLAATRLLSITGPGGTGKTRLAYQLAAEHVHEFPDGVWVAELASTSDARLVPASLMAALGLPDQAGRTPTETIVSHLRSRRALVVLDNCEHLISAAASLAAELLRACGNVQVLTTSREPLRVSGETVWALEPLTLPEGKEVSLAELAGADAVALFCERAADARAGFALTPDNRAAVTKICVRLEGIPLAIELAAARVRTLPLAQMAERLDHSLDLLSKGARGADDRQASLRGAISWSHALLNQPEQVLFRRLAVFAGGFTLEAAEDVCAGEGLAAGDVLDRLDGLVDKSLVSLTEQRAGEGRYRLLETIRAYAAERLADAGEGFELAERHAAFYAYVGRDYAKEGDTITALERLEADHPNLLAALDHLSLGDRSIQHGQLVVDLSAFWDVRGQWRLARHELLRYLGRADRDRALEGRSIRELGHFAYNLGDYGEARARLEEGLGVAQELGDRWLQSQCVGGLGRVEHDVGHFTEARPHLVQALGIARELGERSLEGQWVGALGHAAHSLGDYPEARARYEEALGIARKLRERRREGSWVAGLGEVSSGMGDYPDARARFEEALGIARELGFRNDEGYCYGELGRVAYNLGDYPQARAGYEAALATARELGRRRQEGHWVGCLGDLASTVGEYDEARERFEEALAIHLELGKEDYDLLEATAELLARLDRGEEAAQLLAAGDNLNKRANRGRSLGDQTRFDAALEACRSSLGAEPFAMASERGRALSWESATTGALEYLGRIQF